MTMQPPTGFGAKLRGLPPTEQLRANWAWFLGLGIVAVVAGLVALAITEFATLVSVVTIGVLVAVVGLVEIVLGFRARGWGQALYWEISGLFYVAAGIFAWAEPVQASVVLTLLLGAGLLATGIVRAVAGFRHHDKMRGPLILSGVVTGLLGLLIVSGWPANGLFVIGLLLGIELVFTGINWIFFALRLRSHA
ncbi:HdeD family acid-resistance protein [Lichenibacterium ramalinae]|uniref:HdeD family acid-resistance protein n=1 Tax=Lichenibacterium ramalinae TaxID=2316527 RepID=A0A4V1RIX1_9HYPH|nr:DUF308 domain-containing protein [Lichenibacterium ramalinae]RYB06045.1 HdeD family acid-resistance protein [Lichenibacterium ramalinae]